MRKSIFFLLLPALYAADPQPCGTPDACWTLLEPGGSTAGTCRIPTKPQRDALP
jgi:hypothetical protein